MLTGDFYRSAGCDYIVQHIGESYTFCHDLATSMLNLGHGYDPYNHVGYGVVSDVLGG